MITKLKILSESDPAQPGRIAYQIEGPSAAAVQYAITELMEAEDVMSADFTLPQPIDGGYGALGQVRTGGSYGAS